MKGTIKCFSCKHYWCMMPCMESPYGEEACMKTEQSLWGCTAEDVADCKDYEPK